MHESLQYTFRILVLAEYQMRGLAWEVDLNLVQE